MNSETLTDAEKDLLLFIPDAGRIKVYCEELKSCKRLKEVESQVLIPMVYNEKIPLETLPKREFYLRLRAVLPPAIKHTSSTTLWNHMTDLVAYLKKREAIGQPLRSAFFFR